MNRNEVKRLADVVLRPFLGDAGFINVDVDEGRNEEGEDGLFLTLHFKANAKNASGADLLDAQVSIQRALEEQGDSRFPYFTYD